MWIYRSIDNKYGIGDKVMFNQRNGFIQCKLYGIVSSVDSQCYTVDMCDYGYVDFSGIRAMVPHHMLLSFDEPVVASASGNIGSEDLRLVYNTTPAHQQNAEIKFDNYVSLHPRGRPR